MVECSRQSSSHAWRAPSHIFRSGGASLRRLRWHAYHKDAALFFSSGTLVAICEGRWKAQRSPLAVLAASVSFGLEPGVVQIGSEGPRCATRSGGGDAVCACGLREALEVFAAISFAAIS